MTASFVCNSSALVCLGAVAGAHGVHGALRVKSFCEVPADIIAYGPLYTQNKDSILTLTLQQETKPGFFLARAAEIKNRETAQAWKGTRLFVEKSALPPPPEEEFYHEDLVGLSALTTAGASLGQVKAVVNYGAGDILELHHIPGQQGIILVPFTKIMVPHISIDDGYLTIVSPDMPGEHKAA